MDLDPMINTSQDEDIYSNYDNRPIRPMDQDALNEALARLPILVDEEDLTNITDPNTSIKSRRQPVLAYSTRRKDFSNANTSQSVLNIAATPVNNKRKLGGCTPTNKFIKQLDSRQDLIQLKENNKILEEATANLQLDCALLKKSHEAELETLKQEHQQAINTFIQEHNLQCEQFNASLADKEQLLVQTNLELENLRNDHTMLLLEKETLDKIVNEYELIKQEMNNKLIESETTIQNLRDEIENMTKIQQQKQSTSKSVLTNGRMPLKETSTDRSRMANNTVSKNESNRLKSNAKASTTRGPIGPLSSISTSPNKSTCSSSKPSFSKSKFKSNVVIDDKKKSISTDKHPNLPYTRMKPKIVITK